MALLSQRDYSNDCSSMNRSPSSIPFEVISNSRMWGSCALARVFSTVRARLICDSPRRNCNRTTLSDRCEIPYSDRRVNPEQLGNLLRHEHADPRVRGPLKQRVHVLAEPHLVGGGRAQVAQAVDQDPSDPMLLDLLEELVESATEQDVPVWTEPGPTSPSGPGSVAPRLSQKMQRQTL